MNIKQGGPEQDGDYAASWRELKTRRGICWLVMLAGMCSMHWMISSTSWAMWLLTCVLSFGAIFLSDRFVKAFLCPRCGHKYFRAKDRLLDCGSYKAKACTHCDLPLWSTEKL